MKCKQKQLSNIISRVWTGLEKFPRRNLTPELIKMIIETSWKIANVTDTHKLPTQIPQPDSSKNFQQTSSKVALIHKGKN